MAAHFNEAQRAEFKAAFDYFDQNNDEEISAKELRSVLQNMG